MTRVEEPEMLSVELSGLRHRAYRWHGHGSGTMLLLHGFLDTGRGWAFTAQGLLSSCRFLIALDWRGHGDSEWVGRGGYYHFFDYVRDLEDCVEWLGGGEGLTVVGHSMGAMALTLWAGATSKRVDRIILVEGLGPVAHLDKVPHERINRWLSQMNAVKPNRIFDDLDQVSQRLATLYLNVPSARIMKIAEWSTQESLAGFQWKYDPMHRTRSPAPVTEAVAVHLWKNISVPVMWIGGAQSPWRGVRLEKWLAHRPNLRRQLLPDVGHMIHYENPGALANAIRAFLANT